MTNFVVVSASDIQSEPTFTSLGGHRISPRMGVVPWWGTADQLQQHISRLIPEVVLIASLDDDCIVLGT
jgi:hypothetical protein